MPFDYGLRLNKRQRIANARAKPIKANKNQSVDGAESLFLGSGSPQNVYLLPQRQNFSLERCPRQKQIYDHPDNEPDKISHPATASPDSRSTASQMRFATATLKFQGLRRLTQNARWRLHDASTVEFGHPRIQKGLFPKTKRDQSLRDAMERGQYQQAHRNRPKPEISVNEVSGKRIRPLLLSPMSALKRITDSSRTSCGVRKVPESDLS
jgi:hypothetical protein